MLKGIVNIDLCVVPTVIRHDYGIIDNLTLSRYIDTSENK